MRPGPNRFHREIDPFAHDFGDQLAMADIEGKRHRNDEHDYMPHLWDPEPWRDDPNRPYRPRQRKR